MPSGRPKSPQGPDLPQALIDDVLIRVASGETLRAVSRDLKFPESSWRVKCVKDPVFHAQYMRARHGQAESFADEMIELADKCRQGVKTKVNDDGTKETTTGDMVERSKLQIETRKWLLARLHPAVYSERLCAEVKHEAGDTLTEFLLKMRGARAKSEGDADAV